MTHPSRRDALRSAFLATAGVAAAPSWLSALEALLQSPLNTRPIPSSGERIPVIGIGTARRYDVGATPAERDPLKAVLARFPELGGKLIDTAPGYGAAETVTGDLIKQLGNRDKLFLATKVSSRTGDVAAAGQSIEQSMARFGSSMIDCMQVHNLGGTKALLPMLRDLKAQKKIRYTGMTTSSDRQYAEFEQLMKDETMDIIQVDYAIDNRGAEERILPLAADRGMGVLVNLPFGRTSVFQKVQGRPLPDWSKEIDCTSWAQIFLKYIVSHPSVTAAIPGTAKMEYLMDNIAAARGRVPDAAMRKRIEQYFDTV